MLLAAGSDDNAVVLFAKTIRVHGCLAAAQLYAQAYGPSVGSERQQPVFRPGQAKVTRDK